MTPKEKAKQLVNKFMSATMTLVADYEWVDDINSAKQCALIAVDEMINMCKLYHNHNIIIDGKIYTELTINYFKEVKKEIDLL